MHKKIGRFLTTMDAKAATSVFVTAALLVGVVALLAFGRQWLDLDDDAAIGSLLSTAPDGPAAALLVIGVFAALALTGFPQILLITAAVVAFGPRLGALYAWSATMCSATLTFGLGRFFVRGSAAAGRWPAALGGERIQRFMALLARRGVLTSAVIRLVPSAPFIVVNAAAGAARIPLWKYWAGTGVGIVPKIVMVAALGAVAPGAGTLAEGLDGLAAFFARFSIGDAVALVAIVAAWLALLMGARRLFVKLRTDETPSLADVEEPVRGIEVDARAPSPTTPSTARESV